MTHISRTFKKFFTIYITISSFDIALLPTQRCPHSRQRKYQLYHQHQHNSAYFPHLPLIHYSTTLHLYQYLPLSNIKQSRRALRKGWCSPSESSWLRRLKRTWMQERGKGPSYISLCIWLSRPRGGTQGLSGLILNPPQMHQNMQPYASRRSPFPRRGRPWLHRHLCSSKLLTQGVGTWLLNLVLVYSSTVVLFSLFQLPKFPQS